MTLRVFSYGGGVQSTAALVLAAQGELDFPVFLFANVGDDSENPSSLDYVRNVAMPYAEQHGIELYELHKRTKDGNKETLIERMTKDGSKSLPIPVRMSNGAPTQRACTVDWKIKVVNKWQKEHGATKEEPAICGLGISTDEIQRAKGPGTEPTQILDYPLLTLGLSRADCLEVIRKSGLPIPDKSSCYFCPFHSVQTWTEMQRDQPDLFKRSVDLERTLNERRRARGMDAVWLTRFNRPLDEVIGNGSIQETLWGGSSIGEDGCDEGVCFV